jgi:hypothetical protein
MQGRILLLSRSPTLNSHATERSKLKIPGREGTTRATTFGAAGWIRLLSPPVVRFKKRDSELD